MLAFPTARNARQRQRRRARLRGSEHGLVCRPSLSRASVAMAGLLAVLSQPTAVAADLGGTAEISGVIHITKRLTKRPVEPVATAYHRGMAVQTATSVEDFVLAEMGRVAIYIESEQPLPSEKISATLKQKDRRFAEETIVVPAGSSVSFPNLDPIFHNVFSLSRARSFDLGNYPQNETRSVTFPKPGVVRVYCHLHPNMSASIVVAPNRWAVKPEKDGRYFLSGVPAGNHTLVVWHKSAGFFRKSLRLAAGQTVSADFTIPIGPEAPPTKEQ